MRPSVVSVLHCCFTDVICGFCNVCRTIQLGRLSERNLLHSSITNLLQTGSWSVRLHVYIASPIIITCLWILVLSFSSACPQCAMVWHINIFSIRVAIQCVEIGDHFILLWTLLGFPLKFHHWWLHVPLCMYVCSPESPPPMTLKRGWNLKHGTLAIPTLCASPQ